MKYPEDFIDKIVCGDCLQLIKLVPDNSVDVIITDPPYGLNKDSIKGDDSLNLFYKILPECNRVLKNDSFFITFFSTKFLPELFKNNLFEYFWQIVLYCPSGGVNSPVGITKFMSCFVFRRGNPKVVRRNKDIFVDGVGKSVEPEEGYVDHPALKPKRFIREILKMFTKEGDLVLDPFVGSGSTAVACVQMNRRFIGFEIEEKYCRLALDRVNKFKEVAFIDGEKKLL